jgi:DNA-binding NarL/FixJ family response regulator
LPSPTDVAYAESVVSALSETLGADGFATVRSQGRALPPQEAVAAALALRVVTGVQATSATERRPGPHGLSERELEVLRLVAAGHTTRRIAEALFISHATAARHIANIYAKLDIDSRARAATLALQHGLA